MAINLINRRSHIPKHTECWEALQCNEILETPKQRNYRKKKARRQVDTKIPQNKMCFIWADYEKRIKSHSKT